MFYLKKKIMPTIDQADRKEKKERIAQGTIEEDSFDEYIGESYYSEESSDLSKISEDTEQ